MGGAGSDDVLPVAQKTFVKLPAHLRGMPGVLAPAAHARAVLALPTVWRSRYADTVTNVTGGNEEETVVVSCVFERLTN